MCGYQEDAEACIPVGVCLKKTYNNMFVRGKWTNRLSCAWEVIAKVNDVIILLHLVVVHKTNLLIHCEGRFKCRRRWILIILVWLIVFVIAIVVIELVNVQTSWMKIIVVGIMVTARVAIANLSLLITFVLSLVIMLSLGSLSVQSMIPLNLCRKNGDYFIAVALSKLRHVIKERNDQISRQFKFYSTLYVRKIYCVG